MGLPCLILIVSPLTFKESVFLVTWRWFYIIQRFFGGVVRENIPSEIDKIADWDSPRAQQVSDRGGGISIQGKGRTMKSSPAVGLLLWFFKLLSRGSIRGNALGDTAVSAEVRDTPWRACKKIYANFTLSAPWPFLDKAVRPNQSAPRKILILLW